MKMTSKDSEQNQNLNMFLGLHCLSSFQIDQSGLSLQREIYFKHKNVSYKFSFLIRSAFTSISRLFHL